MILAHQIRRGIRLRALSVVSRRTLLLATLAVLALLMETIPALAGELDKFVGFNIRAESLDKALLEFGAQAHVQLSFAPEFTTAGLRTQQLRGRYTAKAALARLLKGTKLRYVVASEHTIEILPVAPPRISALSSSPVSIHPESSLYPISSSEAEANQSGPPANPSKVKVSRLNEVVVTGSRLPTNAKEGPQEVQIFDSQQIDQSGQTTVSDFLSTLPSVSTSLPAVNAAGYTSTTTLRGLPVGTTLILLDGRRVQESGADSGLYFDLSNIPLASVQRIEVDENGSSAVYGSDAIGGVVNIILKKDFSGFAASAHYGWAKDIRDISSSVTAGRQWSQGGVSVVASYETDGGLLNSDRLLSASNDYTNYGGPDSNYPICAPGNVFSTTGQPLPGAPQGSAATYAAVTAAAKSGEPSFSQFGYGALNECSILSGLSLLPSTKRGSVFLQGHLRVTSNMTLFAEVMYTHLNRVAGSGYGSLSGTAAYQEYTVSPANPFNPFGQTVGVTEDLYDVPIVETLNTSFFRPLLGIRGTIGDQWQWEASTWQSTDWTQFVGSNEFPDSPAIQDALNSSSAESALNPFVSGPPASQALLQSLFADEKQELMGSDRSAEAWLRGPLVEIPSGQVLVVIGGDYVRSILHLNTSGGTGVYASYDATSNYQRRYSAVFGEVKLPLIADHLSDARSLIALTASGRHDSYSDFGGDTTGQLGIEIRPLESLLLRGTYGTAFSAPVLSLLDSPAFYATEFVTDPVSGVGQFVQVKTGGNPNLRPMTGRSHSVGLVYSSRLIPGLQLSLTQWSVVETAVTQSVDPQVLVDNESSFPSRVIRDSTGQIVEVDDTEVNFGSIDVAGLDYQLVYTHVLGGGTASIDLGATETYHYRQSLVPGGQPVESVSQAEDDNDWAPRWKGTVGVGWASSSIGVHLDSRYTGAYTDYNSTSRIGDFWIVDANLHWSIGSWLSSHSQYLSGVYLDGGGTNLFNRAPQFSNYEFDFLGYDPWEASIVGRSVYVTIGSRW